MQHQLQIAITNKIYKLSNRKTTKTTVSTKTLNQIKPKANKATSNPQTTQPQTRNKPTNNQNLQHKTLTRNKTTGNLNILKTSNSKHKPKPHNTQIATKSNPAKY